MSAPDTHGFIMPNGKHAGVAITRVPVSYLKWMVNVGHQLAELARAELDRRGTVTPELEVSGHAIDRASLLLRAAWHETRGEDEGLHAWLLRTFGAALKEGERVEATRVEWRGLSFRFELDGAWPVLKTVLPGRGYRALYPGTRRERAHE